MALPDAIHDPATLTALGRLARLRLDPQQRNELAARLEAVLTAFRTLADADPGPLPPPPEGTPLPLRPDALGPVLEPTQLFANAPAEAAGAFLVPRVVDG